MHPRERILGEIKYRQLRNEPIPNDTLVAAKHWGVLIPDNNIEKTKGEPSDGKD
jgi:hypothetical protein|tara:strand:- start:355 stop:516 length:162 start_codon:yes stop_codon:yes gene_type:complete